MDLPPISIALVDDSLLFRKMLAQYLAGHGFVIACEASNGRELFVQLGDLEILPDVCILDSNMPEMDGYASARKLKAEYPRIGVIGHAFFTRETREQMLNCGAFECVNKDLEPSVLVSTIIALQRPSLFNS